MNYLLLLLITVFATTGQTGHATIIFVNANAQGSGQDGSSWVDAFLDLQDALALAVYGGEIWVAQGDYYPTAGTDRYASFEVPNGVALYGGFQGTETLREQRDWALYPTVLNGDIGLPGTTLDNSFTIVYIQYADSTTILDGFTLTGGNANSNGPNDPAGSPAKNGGAMYIEGSGQAQDIRPTVRNCTFRLNSAQIRGGAVYVRAVMNGSASPIFFNCFFQENAAASGGALYRDGGSFDSEMEVVECTFFANLAIQGAAVNFNNTHGNRDFLFRGCLFQDNYSLAAGGAAHQDVTNASAKMVFDGCVFHFNVSDDEGGAIAVFNFFESYSLYVRNCRFFNNIALTSATIAFLDDGLSIIENSEFTHNQGFSGGCIRLFESSTKVSNCVFANSFASEAGGAIIIHTGTAVPNPAKISITNSSFYSNHSPLGIIHNIGADMELSIANCIFFKNNHNSGGQIISDAPNGFVFENNLVDLPDCASVGNNVTCGPA